MYANIYGFIINYPMFSQLQQIRKREQQLMQIQKEIKTTEATTTKNGIAEKRVYSNNAFIVFSPGACNLNLLITSGLFNAMIF